MKPIVVALFLAATSAGLAAAQPATEVVRLYREGYDRYLQGDLPGAAAWFEQVLRADPNHKAARNRLAEVYLALGRADDARRVAGGGSGLAAATDPPMAPSPSPSSAVPSATSAPTSAAEAPAPPEPAAEAAPPVPAPSAAKAAQAPPAPAAEPVEPAHAEVRSATRAKNQPLSEDEKRRRRNPRAQNRFGVGVAALGGVGGVGAFVELRPAWPIAVQLAGGVLPVAGVNVVFSAQAQWLIAPYRLTPVLGVGAGVALGEAVWLLDPFVAASARGARARATLWPTVGLRLDLGPRFTATVAADLLPGRQERLPIVPVPSLRIGTRF